MSWRAGFTAALGPERLESSYLTRALSWRSNWSIVSRITFCLIGNSRPRRTIITSPARSLRTWTTSLHTVITWITSAAVFVIGGPRRVTVRPWRAWQRFIATNCTISTSRANASRLAISRCTSVRTTSAHIARITLGSWSWQSLSITIPTWNTKEKKRLWHSFYQGNTVNLISAATLNKEFSVYYGTN